MKPLAGQLDYTRRARVAPLDGSLLYGVELTELGHERLLHPRIITANVDGLIVDQSVGFIARDTST